MEIESILLSRNIKEEAILFDDNLAVKADALVNLLQTQSWQHNVRLYNLASILFKQVVRGKYDDLTKTELSAQVKKIKELFQQFQEKPMSKAYMVEKQDSEHHNGSQLKKYAIDDKLVIDEADLSKIPQVYYGDRGFRFDTWVPFEEDGRVLGFADSATDEIARIYVMDPFGQFYMYEDIPGSPDIKAIKHSSFFSGRPVAGSGKFFFNKQGQLIKVTNSSGHYRFGEEEMRNTLLALKYHGVDLSQVTVRFHSHNAQSKIETGALAWLETAASTKMSF